MDTETIGGSLFTTPHQATVMKLGLSLTIVPTNTVGATQVSVCGCNCTFSILFTPFLFLAYLQQIKTALLIENALGVNVRNFI